MITHMDASEFHLMFSGLLFGLSAGLSPGPLLTLVIGETLRHDARAGLMVAVSPLFTDLPIILLSLLVMARIPDTRSLFAIISLSGGVYIAWLGYESLRFRGADLALPDRSSHSLRKGIIANFLNPHPYLFWMTVGGPLLIHRSDRGFMGPVLFFSFFYLLLVGSKMGVAAVVGRYRNLMKSIHYVMVIRSLGFVLLLFAGLLIQGALRGLLR